jgi:DNA-binding MarR family transcriptional regulator
MTGLTVRPAQLTDRQRAVLAAIAKRGPVNGQWVMHALGDEHASVRGVHQTAASLVRRGLVAKHRDRGYVTYSATDAGRAVIA